MEMQLPKYCQMTNQCSLLWLKHCVKMSSHSQKRMASPITSPDRVAAVAVPRALEAGVHEYRAGERRRRSLESAARRILDAEPRARVEYVTAFDGSSLASSDVLGEGSVIAAAVWFGDVRLIDNMPLA